MNIENQVVSLELSKKLDELCIRQENIFYWHNIDTPFLEIVFNNYRAERSGDSFISAFTIAELMEMLPACIDTGKDEPFNHYWLLINKRTAHNIKYIANYYCDTTSAIIMGFTKLFSCHDERFADCLARTLIYCVENRWVKP